MKKKSTISVLNAVLMLLALVQIVCIVWAILAKSARAVTADAPRTDLAEKPEISQMAPTLDAVSADEVELLQIKAGIEKEIDDCETQLAEIDAKRFWTKTLPEPDIEMTIPLEEVLANEEQYPELCETITKALASSAKLRTEYRAAVLKALADTNIAEEDYRALTDYFAAWDEFDAHLELRKYDVGELPAFPNSPLFEVDEDGKVEFADKLHDLLREKSEKYAKVHDEILTNAAVLGLPKFFLDK